MNAVSQISMVAPKEWMTTAEFAALALANFPATDRGVEKLAKREEWATSSLARKRAGRGGGMEYHVSLLPPTARAELEARARRAAAEKAHADLTAIHLRQISKTAPASLTARQRLVMEARAAVLLEIDRRVTVEGQSRRAAVLAFIAEFDASTLPSHLATIAARANDKGRGLSRSAIYNWFSAREQGGVVAAAPRITRQKEPLPDWFGRFLTFYATPQKRTIPHVLALWKRATPDAELPSESQVRRALGKLGAADRARGREGALSLKRMQAFVARDTTELLPTSVYVGDGKTFDAEIAHPIHGQPFRPEITSIIDARTRRLVGFSAALDESAAAVLDALRRACMTAGIPALFYTDNGPGYVNEAMDAPLTGFLGRLGITSTQALPYNSQAKGIVERLNHLWSHLAREFPTYIGRDMDMEARKAAFKATRKELALTGTSRILPSWQDFLTATAHTLEGYNATPHSSLPKIRDLETGKMRHQTPDEAWFEACGTGFEPIIVTEEEADDLFRPWVVRRARRCLVEWLGNSYFAAELDAWHDCDVIVGYDVADASKVWLREIDEVDGERMAGRLIGVGIFEGHKTRYVPLTKERDAIEKRAAAALKRLDKKATTKRAELAPPALVELIATNVIPMPGAPRPEPVLSPVRPPKIVEMATGRPRFDNEQELALWCLEHPDQVTDHDHTVLREELTSSTSRRLMEMRGVDVAALRNLVATIQPQQERQSS